MSIQVLSAELFRQKLAGLIDKKEQLLETEIEAMTKECINFLLILPRLFSDDFDRKTLWERIGNGIDSSIAKCSGDFNQFINLNLEYIKAEPGKVASCQPLLYFIQSMELRPKVWIAEFLKTMSKKKFIIIVKARSEWEAQKKTKEIES